VVLADALSGAMAPILAMLANVTSALLLLVAALCLVMLVVGGIRYVTAAGDMQGTMRARKTVEHSLIGLGVALAAPVLIQIVKALVGG
jgi:VIT1/CCC1 family predicted Fe2+/Mn2+ transporter